MAQAALASRKQAKKCGNEKEKVVSIDTESDDLVVEDADKEIGTDIEDYIIVDVKQSYNFGCGATSSSTFANW